MDLNYGKVLSLRELTEVMRQRDVIAFIDLLNQVRVGDLDEEHKKLLKTRFISKNILDYPSESIHIFAENAPADQYNSEMLDKLPTTIHNIFPLDELPKQDYHMQSYNLLQLLNHVRQVVYHTHYILKKVLVL